MEWIEEDLTELAVHDPDAETIRLLSANPLVLACDKLVPVFETIHKFLPRMKQIYLAGRVSDLKNKTVDELQNTWNPACRRHPGKVAQTGRSRD